MSEHRRAATRPPGTSIARRRRLLVGALGALGAGGLILGGVGFPVSADELTAGGNPHASVEVRDGCVTAAAGTGGAGGSVAPQQGSDDATVEAAGQATATVTVCPDDPGGSLPDDPVGSLPDDPVGSLPDDPVGSLPDDPVGSLPDHPGESLLDEIDDVVPGEPGGSLEGEVVAIVTAALEGELPGGGDGPLPGDLPDGPGGIVPGDGSLPGDPGDLPGRVGGLVPDGAGLDVDDLFERLGQIITGDRDGAGPGHDDGSGAGGNGGGGAAVNTSTNGSVAVGGVNAERGDPTDVVLGGGAPALVGTSVSPGGTLPRTGGGLGIGVLRLVAVLGFGRGLVGLAKRR